MGKRRINWEGNSVNIEEQIDPLRKKGDFSIRLLCLFWVSFSPEVPYDYQHPLPQGRAVSSTAVLDTGDSPWGAGPRAPTLARALVEDEVLSELEKATPEQ